MFGHIPHIFMVEGQKCSDSKRSRVAVHWIYQTDKQTLSSNETPMPGFQESGHLLAARGHPYTTPSAVRDSYPRKRVCGKSFLRPRGKSSSLSRNRKGGRGRTQVYCFWVNRTHRDKVFRPQRAVAADLKHETAVACPDAAC